MNNKQYIAIVGTALALVFAGVLLVAPSRASAQYDYGSYYGSYGDYGNGGYGSYGGYGDYGNGFDISLDFGGSGGYGSGYDYGCNSCGNYGNYGNYGGYNYGCGSCSTPVYTYTAPSLPPVQPNYESLRVTCYAQPVTAQIGQTIQWVASAYGGNGAYNYSWTGTDGLSGIGSMLSKIYYSSGNKNATVTVTSGGQNISKNCDGSVMIYGNPTPPPPVYTPPPVYNPPPVYAPISVSCSASMSNIQSGSSVTWNAYVSGGFGNYYYTWYGNDGLSGNSGYVTKYYSTPGVKYASVTVQSNGQSVSQQCSNVVTVSQPVYQQPVIYPQPVPVIGPAPRPGLDIGCYSDPNTVSVNQPTTWIAEVSGGVQPYTFEWTGSDNITGNAPSIIKYYSTTGEKNAIVTVRSSNGLTGTRTCSNTVKVKGTAVPAKPVARPVAKPKPDCGCTTTPGQPVPTQPVTQVQPQAVYQPAQAGSASSIFALSNIPWGWVAVLVILVLFATLMYVIFNRQKI